MVCFLLLGGSGSYLFAAALQQAPAHGPKIWLQDNQSMAVAHTGAAAQNPGLMGAAQPVSLTSGDIDGDGVADLLVGYRAPGGGVIAVHRGNLDAFAPQSDASFQAIGRGEFPSPFLQNAHTFTVPFSPDFIALGNLTGNGNQDLVAAAKGGNALYVFPGDGNGNFGTAQSVNLPGGVTSLAAGQFGNSAHFATVIVNVSGIGNASSLVVFGGSQQGLSLIRSYPLTAPASNILFGEFGDPGPDAAFLSGGKVSILRSSNLQVQTLSLPVTVRAMATGGFIYDRNASLQLALLASDGSIQIAAHSEFDSRPLSASEMAAIRGAALRGHENPLFPAYSFPVNGWKIIETFPSVGTVAPGQTPLFFRTRVSSNGADDIMWLNASAGQMAVISHANLPADATTFVPGQVSVKPYNGSPVQALPLRINIDNRPGVIAIHQGNVAPSMLMPIPDPTFFVNRFDDPTPGTVAGTCNNVSNVDNSSSCSLREAILKANATAGTDTVQLIAGTYTLTLPKVPGDFTGQHGTLEVIDSINIVGAVDGGGNPASIIQAGTAGFNPGPANGVDKILSINEDITVSTTASASLSNLVLRFGRNIGDALTTQDGFGGAFDMDINNSGATLTITNCNITDNETTDGEGGGFEIFNTGGTAATTGFAQISNSTVQNNRTLRNPANGDPNAAGNGGGITIAWPARLIMTNTKVLNNLATQTQGTGIGLAGGLFLIGGSNFANPTTIHGGQISGNQSAGDGGGIWNDSGLTIDQGTVISGNTAGTSGAGSGGGIWFNAATPRTGSISKVAITGNAANASTGFGGGLEVSTGTGLSLTMSFSRLAGNTAHTGSNLDWQSVSGATVTATNNWWGTNNAASTITKTGTGTLTFDPFIVLTHSGIPAKIRINQSSTLTGDMSKDNHANGAALAGNLDRIVGLPITFDNPVLGSIPQAQPETLNASAQATATFNAGGVGGTFPSPIFGSANATVDQGVVPVDSNLIASATEVSTTATITTVGAHGFSPGQAVKISGVGVAGYNSPANQLFSVAATPTATTFTYTANNAGLAPSSGGTATGGIVILAPPSITKSFSPTTVAIGAPSTITFAINNPNVVTINASFTDTLPLNLVVATPPNVVNNCGGTVTANAGAGSISFSNAAQAVGSCTINVNVQSAVDSIYSNSVTIDSTDAGNGNTATTSPNLTVINPPHIAKAFGAASIPLNGTTSLTLTIDSNSNQNLTLTGVAFTDNLPAGLIVATPGNLNSTCSGTATAADGSSTVSLSGASVAPNTSCIISLTVQGTTAGVKNNSVQVTSTNGGTGNTANASITVVAPPTISKAFNPTSIALNASSTLSFTITNPNTASALSGVAFTDNLPAGLVVAATPNVTGSCGSGTITATAGSSTISLSGGTLTASPAAGSSCTFSVDVTGTTAGDKSNTTGAVTSTEGGTGATSNTALLTVVAPPSIAKVFNPSTIALNATTSLTFTITNPAENTVALTGVAFTDTLPTGLTVANASASVCGGTLTTTAPTGIALTGATIAVNSQCVFSVTVTGAASGQYTNTTGNVTSTNGGTGNTASASLTVASPPTITKAFGAASIPLNGTTSLSFTITNPNTFSPLSGVAFTDNLPAGLVVAATPNVTGSCGSGTITAVAGSGAISLSGGTLTASPAAGSSCTFSVDVTGTTAGVKLNTTGAISSTEGGTGTASNTASLTVVAPPTISKAFNPTSIALNATSTLSFTITNPNTASALSGVAFTDNLPAGVVVAATPNVTGSCGSGTITALAGSSTISLSGGTLTASPAAGSSCTFSVDVTGTTAGSKSNTTGTVSSTEGGTGATSNTAILTVEAPPSLTFTITNPAANAAALTGVAFTDTLPTGLTVANASATVCGGTLTTTAPTGIALSGATINTNSQCQFSVTVTGAASGIYTNTTGNVTSTNGGTGNTASANLTVASAPTITKSFNPTTIALNGNSALSFTINNPNTNVALTGVAFTDTLPAGLVVATPNGLTGSCGSGTVTATAGSGAISLSGGTLTASPGAGSSCTFSVNVTGTTAGVKNNSVTVTSTEGGTGNTSSASITVIAAATIAKSFGAASIPLNGSTSLSFTINNANTTTALTGVGFTDALPAGLVVSTPNGLTGSCGGGTITAVAGSGSVSLTGASLAASASCTFSINVTGTSAGNKTNTTGAITSNEGGTGGTATASINVVAPPAIAKAFNPTVIAVNGVSTLTFTITNPAANAVALTGVAFTDTLPAGIVVATPNNLGGTCSGTPTAVAGSGTVSLTGATVAAASSCTVNVDVTGSAVGVYNNTSGAVSSTNGGTGNTASASLTIAVADLTITKTHAGTFTRGQNGANYTITVKNSGAGPTSGTVTVVDTLPSVTHPPVPTAMSGTGWSCTLATLTCTRSDALAPGASYPAITLTVNIPINIENNFTNKATVSGGGETNTGNDTASDPVSLGPPIVITPHAATATVTAGSSASFVFDVEDDDSTLGMVTFGCSGLPVGTACTFNPPSTNLPLSQINLTITTSKDATVVRAQAFGVGNNRHFYAAWFFPVLGLVGIAVSGRKNKKARMRLALLLMGIVMLLSFAGCGGAHRITTPAGNYQITVTAATTTVQATTQVTMTVQ